MRRYKALLIAGAALSLGISSAMAEPSALVEDITTDRNDVQFMDYLEPGTVIELAPDETLTVGYLLSCVQETITGGKVTIGEDESVVSGGAVESTEVDCDGGAIVADANIGGAEVAEAAGGTRNTESELPELNRIIFGISPIIKLSANSTSMIIQEIYLNDSNIVVREKEEVIPVSSRIVDFEAIGIKLTRGSTYELVADGRKIVFKVSRLAEEEGVPPVARLLPL